MTSDQERAAPAQQPVADVAQKIADECWLDSLQKHTLARRIRKALASSEPELRAEIVRLTRERDELRLAIAGKPMLDGLYHGQYLEMAHTLHAACAGGRERAEAAESRVEALSAEVGTARAAAFEEAAQEAGKFAEKARGMLARAKKRSHQAGLLIAAGYQGDPDAELMEIEIALATAEDIAAAIRSRAALDKGATS